MIRSTLLVMLAALPLLHGCCDPQPPVRSGRYLVTADPDVPTQLDYEFLRNAELTLDLEAKTATLRYERDGQIVDVKFDVE